MNRGWIALGAVTSFIVFALLISTFTRTPALAPRLVTDVQLGTVYQVGHTFKCVLATGEEVRDWHLLDRWIKNQLSIDTYEVDGRTFSALRLDPTLPKGHVRFRKELVNVGTGPSLEGHDYMKTIVNGREATVEREILFVEYNCTLESQARPLPACGTPRG